MKTDKQKLMYIEENEALKKEVETLTGMNVAFIRDGMAMEAENTRLAAEHGQVHKYNEELGRENQGLKRQVRALEDSRAFWKREWRLSEAYEKKSADYIKTLEDDRTLAALNISAYKHALNACQNVIFAMEGQRKSDAQDGQSAMDECNNTIILLKKLLKHRSDLYFELLGGVGNKCLGETRHETAMRYIKQAEQPWGTTAGAEEMAAGKPMGPATPFGLKSSAESRFHPDFGAPSTITRIYYSDLGGEDYGL